MHEKKLYNNHTVLFHINSELCITFTIILESLQQIIILSLLKVPEYSYTKFCWNNTVFNPRGWESVKK